MELKIAFFIIVISVSNVFATPAYSQVAKVSLNMENKSLEQVMDEIESQSEFYFIFNQKQIDVNRVVDIQAENKLITDILPDLFKGTNVNYVVLDRKILLTTDQVENNLLATASNTESQQRRVTGTVADKNGPMPGVNVVVTGTTQGTLTDISGNYSIDVPQGAKSLTFSFVGTESQEIIIGALTQINVTMTESAFGLGEVVVVGYGTQTRVSLTGSVASIHSEKLTVAPVGSTTNALAGRLPGLIAKQESGAPGGDASSLSIRGFGAPLVIVDGIESSFNNIDVNEIESISVLKDGSAAIYGARAGNGVILVTTKRGNSDRPVITLNSTMSFQGATNMPKIANSGQMAELIREAWLNSGKPEATARFTQAEVDLFYAGTNPDYPNTDWMKVVGRDWAPEQQHNLSVRGGSDQIKYYGFLGYFDQQSMFKINGNEYKRFNLRSNIDAKILDNLSLQFDFSTIVDNNNGPYRPTDKEGSIWTEYWNTEPFWNPTLPDPTKLAYGGTGAVGIHAMSNSAINGYNRINSQNIKGTLTLNYTFNQVKGLSVKAFANYNQDYRFFKGFITLPDSYSYSYSNDTYTQRTSQNIQPLDHNDSKNRVLTGQLSANYDRTFADIHHLSAVIVYEAIDYNSDWISASRTGYKSFGIDYLFAGGLANQTANGSASEMGRVSYISRVNYDYKSKYLIESTLRIDESAKFSKETRRGTFPSVSLGWRLTEEKFVKDNIPSLENLKLRASFSQAGNDAIGNFQYLSGYGYGLPYVMGSSASTGLRETGLANPFLTWETMTMYNLGIDFALNKRKLYGEMDLFYRDRDGIPGTRSVSLPTTFGASLPTENLNKINTRGFELILGNEGKWEQFNWDISANISWSRSKWGFFDESVYADPDQKRQNQKTGQWTDRVFGYVSEGLFTSQEEIDALTYKYNETQGNVSLKPGDIRFKDNNDDGLLNWRDQAEIGKGAVPHWMGGININLKYRNFDMTTLFQGAFGFSQKINLFPGTNYSIFVYNNRWNPENNKSDELVPRLSGAASNSWNSDFHIKNSDYLRLKTFSLGYNLPPNLIEKFHLKNLRLYIGGMNLLTFSSMNKYSLDPEAPDGLGGYAWPQQRTITFGLNLSL